MIKWKNLLVWKGVKVVWKTLLIWKNEVSARAYYRKQAEEHYAQERKVEWRNIDRWN